MNKKPQEAWPAGGMTQQGCQHLNSPFWVAILLWSQHLIHNFKFKMLWLLHSAACNFPHPTKRGAKLYGSISHGAVACVASALGKAREPVTVVHAGDGERARIQRLLSLILGRFSLLEMCFSWWPTVSSTFLYSAPYIPGAWYFYFSFLIYITLNF